MPLHLKKIGFAAGIILLCAIISFDFFKIHKYPAYPWYHIWGNDVESAYAGQTVAIVNGGEMYFVLHPGAPVFTLHGTIYKILSFVNPAYQKIFRLSEVKTSNEPLEILDLATRTSRVISFWVSLIFIGVLLVFIWRLTGRLLLSFLFGSYIVLSQAFFVDYPIVRPEILNLLLFFTAALWYLGQKDKIEGVCLKKYFFVFVPMGVLLGTSILAKIQIVPAVLSFMLIIVYGLWEKNRRPEAVSLPNVRKCAGAFLLNLILMPWWALKRPDFLTPESLRIMHHASDYKRVYGTAPENFYGLMAVFLIGLNLLPWVFWALKRYRAARICAAPVLSIVLTLNLLITGGIISAYFVFLPISTSLAGYVENTRHLVYSLFTHVFSYEPVFAKTAVSGNLMGKILYLHQMVGSLLTVNIMYWAALAAAWSVFKFFKSSTAQKKTYALILLMFLTAFLMDLACSMRTKKIYDNYAIYSVSLYGLGLALFAAAAFSDARLKIARGCLITVLILNAFWRGYDILKQPLADGISRQDPKVELLNSVGHGRPFWNMSYQGLMKNAPQ